MPVKSIIIYLGYFFLAVLFESCDCKYTYRIAGVYDFYAVDIGGQGYSKIDTVKSSFGLRFLLEMKEVSSLDKYNFINHSYANSIPSCPDMENEIVSSAIRLVTTENFVYDGDTVQSGANLVQLPGVEPYISEQGIYIEFDDAFMGKASFRQTTHTFTMIVSTTDSLVLEKSKQLYFKTN